MKPKSKEFKINLFGTLFEIVWSIKITKKVPRYVTVKPDTRWIYAGARLKVHSVYMEEGQFDEPGTGRHLRLSLIGTEFEYRNGGVQTTTVIQEKDLILEY